MSEIYTKTDILKNLDLDRYFEEANLKFDLREGVIHNPARTRVCILSTDFLSGIYQAVYDEAGPAWKIIFKNCGLLWGERLAKRVDQECQAIIQTKLADLTLEAYLNYITAYFQFHGWGTVKLDISKARETGIVEARLTHSVFADIVKNPEDMADYMLAGILSSMLSYISGAELDCVQTACMSKGAPESRFIITSADRAKDIESMVESKQTHEQIIEKI